MDLLLMFRDENTLMEYHYKRNLELKTMMDNLDQFSVEEIENCSLPKWMRLALLNSKNRSVESSKYVSMRELVLKSLKEGVVEDVTGNMFRWTGGERFIYFGKSQILIKTNDLFFITAKGIWLDTVFTDKHDPNLDQYIFISICSFNHYKRCRQQEIQARMPNFDTFLPVLGADLSNNPTQAFTIYKLQ